MSILISFARSLSELATRNVLTLRVAKFRFQFAPGADDALGIADLPWSLTLNGNTVSEGRTPANGEVNFLISPSETLILRIFDTDYKVTMHAGLEQVTERNGQQKRLDSLGYMSGYLRIPIANEEPDDDDDGPRTRQAILNFQTDTNLAMDSDPGSRTRQKLTDTYGA